MSIASAAGIVLDAVRQVLPVNPWLAALWLLSALGFAALLVYGWHALMRR